MSMHGLGQPRAVIRLLGWTLDQWAIAIANIGDAGIGKTATETALTSKQVWSQFHCHEPGVGMVRWDDPEPDYEAAHKLFDNVLEEAYTISCEGGDDHVSNNADSATSPFSGG